MADFEAQVKALTSLTISSSGTIPTQAQLTQFLHDGVLDVTAKWLSVRPEDSSLFMNVTGAQVAQGADINAAKVISVLRADGVVATNLKDCRRIPVDQQYTVTDPISLNYSSKLNPAFMINADGTVHVFPAPSDNSGLDSYKVFYVNNTPVDGSATSLTFEDSTIGYFPSDKVYLVVLYAAIKSIEAKLSDSAVNEEDTELVQSLVPTLQALQNDYGLGFIPDRNMEAMRGRTQQRASQR